MSLEEHPHIWGSPLITDNNHIRDDSKSSRTHGLIVLGNFQLIINYPSRINECVCVCVFQTETYINWIEII